MEKSRMESQLLDWLGVADIRRRDEKTVYASDWDLAKRHFLENENSPFFKELKCRVEVAAYAPHSNCAGGALCWTGEQEYDSYVHTSRDRLYYKKDVFDFLDKMEGTRIPELGAIVVWTSKRSMAVGHMGVITHLEPLRITHREKCEGRIFVDQPFEEIRYNRYFDVGIEGFLPNRLLDSEERQILRRTEDRKRVKSIEELKLEISGRSSVSAYFNARRTLRNLPIYETAGLLRKRREMFTKPKIDEIESVFGQPFFSANREILKLQVRA